MLPRYKVKVRVHFDPKDLARVEGAIDDALELTALGCRNYIIKNAKTLFRNGGTRIIAHLANSPVTGTKTGRRITMGWTKPADKYGWVNEFAPDKSTWEISPRKRGVKSLRFYSRSTGKLVFRKKVTRVWSDASLRPHWAPALDNEMPQLIRRLKQAVVNNG
jgi:hypothetical protein